jgi:DNA repair protein RadC
VSLPRRLIGWFSGLRRDQPAEEWRRAPHPGRGLEEGSGRPVEFSRPLLAAFEGDPPAFPATHPASTEDARDVPFPSTGPHGHRHRMRVKLLQRGPDALADYELLEMLLFFAMPKGDTKPLAKSLINSFGSFARVLSAPQRDLMQTRGLGEHSVAAIKLVHAAALRLARAEAMEAPILNNRERLSAYLAAAISREKIEQFRVLFLDARNRLIADEAQARGTVNHTPVYPREVVKRALELHSTALILVHNHPSGDPTPSEADLSITEEVTAAAAVLRIAVHDHIIVGNGQQFSFRQHGLIGRA